MSIEDRRRIIEQWIRELSEQEKRARDEREALEGVLVHLDAPGSAVAQFASPVEDAEEQHPVHFTGRKLDEALIP